MSDYWFKPKTHGYGAAPTNWKGWAATLAYVVALVGVSYLMLGGLDRTARVDGGMVVAWLVTIIAITGGFLLLTKAKTDGEWKWRWGEKK